MRLKFFAGDAVRGKKVIKLGVRRRKVAIIFDDLSALEIRAKDDSLLLLRFHPNLLKGVKNDTRVV